MAVMNSPIKASILFVFLFLTRFNEGVAQDCVLAGDRMLSHYTDVNPDYSLPVPWSTDYVDYNLDIDENGVTDFIIINYFLYTGLSGANSHTKIEGVGQNKISGCFYSSGFFADTLSLNDTICGDDLWKSSCYFIKSWSSWSSGGGYNYNLWEGLSNKHVGLKLFRGVDSTYGWIQLRSNSNVITVNDYGCGLFPDENDLLEPADEGVVVFPNPTNGLANIYLKNEPVYSVELYNDRGEIIYRTEEKINRLDLSIYPTGIYMLRIIAPTKTYNEKIVLYKTK